jgi:hypothetical protein
MSITDVLEVCQRRGLRLNVARDTLRLHGDPNVVDDTLRVGLKAHKQTIIEAYGDGVIPDPTLPDVIRIPVWCPNTVTAIKSCVDEQRLKAA